MSYAFAIILALTIGAAPPRTPSQDSDAVYRTLLLRAAPGHLQEVLDAWQARLPAYDAAKEERPLILRHSQGDQWDLMLLFPIRTMQDYYGGARAQRWRGAGAGVIDEGEFERRMEPLIAWREETFVEGPAVSVLRARDAGSAYYHVEMFVSLPDKRRELLEQRRMENRFLEAIGRRENLIFTRLAGASWDLYTVGFYRDLQHYAEPSTVSAEATETKAREAGFTSRAAIGTYLRELIQSHHDTLATRVH